MKHPCDRCQTSTPEEHLVLNPTRKDEFLCPRCLKRTLRAIETWQKRHARRKVMADAWIDAKRRAQESV